MAVGSGLVTVAAFPDWSWGPLAFVALVPFLLVLRGASPRHGFALGLAWGLAFFLGALYWVTHVMVNYGHMAPPLAVFAWVALAVILAGYPALFGWAVARLGGVGPTLWALAVSVLWVAVELLRAHLLTGFPWVLLGYSQGASPVLIQVARITGVYGVSFVVALTNAALAAAAFPGPPAPRRAAPLAVAAVLLLGVAAYGLAVLRDPPPPGEVRVGIVQGNIDQGVKWSPAMREATVAQYRRLTLAVARERPALVVWPEAAMPFLLRLDPRLGPQALAVAREAGVPILMSSPDQVGPGVFENSAFLVAQTGEIQGKYSKRHLVPFGEYVPLRRIFFFLDKLAVPVGDFIPGREVTVFRGPYGRFGVSICYEVIFPDEVREELASGAEFLVNITNDAWFGRTSAPYQHLAMAAFRAVENNVYMVRAANTGISAIIEPSGRIAESSGLYVDAAFVGRIRPGGARTFYTRHGNVFAWICAAAAAACVAAGRRRR
jgi:apolipoprotein N-acyltransferase